MVYYYRLVMKISSDFQIANKYKAIKKIGSGSFGEVYIANELTSGMKVAVKLVH